MQRADSLEKTLMLEKIEGKRRRGWQKMRWLDSHHWLKGHVVIQSLSRVWFFVAPWATAYQASLSFTVSRGWLKFMSIELVMPSNSLILCCSLLFLPSVFPASGSFPMNRLFASGGQSIGASTSASVLPMDVQGWFSLGLTVLISLLSMELLSLLQHHNSKALVLHPSAFFYGPTLISVHDYWKNHSFNSIVVTVFMCF